MSEKSNIISIFDLDGTLSRKDTYLPYLLGFLARNPGRWIKAIALPFAVTMFYLKMRNNQWLKETFLNFVLGGEEIAAIEKWNSIYLRGLYKNGLRQDIVEILKARQREGDTIILCTASLDIYVPDIAEYLNIEHLTCTHAQWIGDKLTGKLKGDNCYGHEKLRRVKEYLHKNDLFGEIHVYTDHASDWPIIEYAHKRFAVYPTKKMRTIALKENIEIID